MLSAGRGGAVHRAHSSRPGDDHGLRMSDGGHNGSPRAAARPTGPAVALVGPVALFDLRSIERISLVVGLVLVSAAAARFALAHDLAPPYTRPARGGPPKLSSVSWAAVRDSDPARPTRRSGVTSSGVCGALGSKLVSAPATDRGQRFCHP